ncbi:hypothetical protein MAPG_11106 [Magnaporthiopsis poae ATCC 64411]|uniref:DNA/RNA-binding protein Alba-like domain-containing protein n=1 Tax=Magnaporthiopsis poae (strain ATCC 64411 / 73-15) TaxID=644358 RepID=A0A0C4EED5_MAGP6|nr:hypothetical protein MAPG_11106 [Magnaporthiopsis poae ATCC 64411]
MGTERTRTATMAASVLPSTIPALTKRKLNSQPSSEAASKRQRISNAGPQPAPGLPSEPHESLLMELRPKYDVATFSVISSTSIAKRIDQILAHLGRFHPVNMAVLPGVVLMHARSRDAAKMVSVTELVRRRIHDGGQKWYQYNRVYEVEAGMAEGDTVIEETVVLGSRRRNEQASRGPGDAARDDYLDASPAESTSSVFERAVLGQPKSGQALYMSIFLSRVPIPELRAKDFITAQSNSDSIDQQRRRQYG